MNPQKKPRTSLYSDQLTKHWSNCSAGFEDLPSSKRSSTKESQKKKFKYEGWGDRWEEEEEKEEEVDIVWSSSSEDEDTGAKGIRTLNSLSHRSGTVTIKSAASGKSAGCHQARKKSSRHGKAAMASWNNMSWDARDTSLEDSIIGDSSSDEDNRESPRDSCVQNLKDGSPPRAENRTARVESVGVQEGPRKKEKETTPSARARSGNTVKASHFIDRGKRQYVQSKQDSFEPEILDDSPSEEESPSVSEVMISKPSSASQSSWSRGHPNTSTTTTSPKPNPMGSPRTGSEWVKKLKLQASITPERRSAGAGEDNRGAGSASGGAGAGIVDSARKKKKFVSSGLAERLQRLVSREKSSIAMWYHNQADSQNSQQEPTKSGLVVKILSCETHRGLYLTYCVTQVSNKSKVTDGSKVKRGGDQAGCSQGDEMYVFFTRSTGDQLGLAKDMLISIHTPWQKLSIPDVSKPVVLCTYFCQPVNLDPTDIVQHQPILPECPTEGSKSSKVLNPVRLFPAAAASSHSPGADIAPTQENKARNISASIMQSVSETGACSSSGISFKATVQRIVTRRQQTVVPHQSARMVSSRNSLQAQASPSLIKSLLLQDREGVVCEVQLTNQMAESTTWQQVLQSGEGRSYIFMNLRVTQRLTLARAPGLSSMIRSLQQHHPNQVSGQTVCYVLTSELGMTAVEAIEWSESAEVPPHKPPAVMDLCDVVKNTQTPKKRTSFSATPILLSPTSLDHVIPSSGLRDTPNNPGSWFLFLSTSAGLHHHHSTTPREESTSHSRGLDKYVRLHVHPSNVLGEEVLISLKNGGNRIRIFCRDILVTSTQDGVFLNADGFSYISTEDDSEVESIPDIVLSVLKVGSRLHSLVRVSGNICGVEEETAFSWPACPQCGNNHLDGGEGSGFVLHCSQCNKDVNSPLIRMHLIVLLTYPTLPSECTVKVQLLQSTIESVLPSPSSQASGGHDLQSILGVLIGPMNCLVRTVSESSERKVFLLEEVLLLNCGFAGTVGIV